MVLKAKERRINPVQIHAQKSSRYPKNIHFQPFLSHLNTSTPKSMVTGREKHTHLHAKNRQGEHKMVRLMGSNRGKDDVVCVVLLVGEIDEAEEVTPDVDSFVVDVEGALCTHLLGHCWRPIVIYHVVILP